MKTNRKTILWAIAIVLIIINQLLIISFSTYVSPNLITKVIFISTDIFVGIVISLISALILAIIFAIIPYRLTNYKIRFISIMPISLIFIELIMLLFKL